MRWPIWPKGLAHGSLYQSVSFRRVQAGRGVSTGHDELGPTSTYFQSGGMADPTGLRSSQRMLARAKRSVSSLEPPVDIVANSEVGEKNWI